MAGIGIIVNTDFGPTGWATGAALARQQFVAGASRAFILDPSFRDVLFQDREGLVPVVNVGDPVRRINDRSGQNRFAELAAEATAVPTLGGDGARSWVQIPLGAPLRVVNPLQFSSSYTAILGVRVDGVQSGTSYNLMTQFDTGNAYLAMQIGITGGKIAANVASAGGWEVVGPDMTLGADHVVVAQKNVAGATASVKLDAGAPVQVGYAVPTSAETYANTMLFTNNPAGPSVSGRLYYAAFVNAIRDPSALAAVAAQRTDVAI